MLTINWVLKEEIMLMLYHFLDTAVNLDLKNKKILYVARTASVACRLSFWMMQIDTCP